jgi:hypothetical protein
LGIFVSAAGFRFLGQIVSVDAKNSQYSFFLAADVLLTGAVFAGGSKLIHQIFSVYDSFMNATQDSAAKKGAFRKMRSRKIGIGWQVESQALDQRTRSVPVEYVSEFDGSVEC